ncbi:MAG TPA: Uma2 family endonuclease [Terriglobales bacterium]|nr:Uma2 family endonuclease [Terriglobales bacterium]
MSATSARTKRWSRLEYERLVELGAFQPGDRVELVAGELLVREPQGSPHATGIRAVEEALRSALGSGWEVRTQMPVALDDESEPEPDVIVAPGSFRDYSHAHPSRPALLVEVADSSLAYDREDKGSLYARARVPEYWIVNLEERVLEVYRESGPDAAAAHGWTYRTTQRLGPEDCVTPLAAPSARIRVADLLP